LRYRVSLSGKPITTQVGCARCCFFVYTAIPRVMVVQRFSTAEPAPLSVCTYLSLNHLSTAPHAADRPQASRSSGFNQKSYSKQEFPAQVFPTSPIRDMIFLSSLTVESLTFRSGRSVQQTTTRRVTQDPECDDDGISELS
jgi:hypothetical protein